MTLAQILQLRVATGSCPADSQKYFRDRLHEAFLPDTGYVVDKLQDGGRWPCPGAVCLTVARLPSIRTLQLICTPSSSSTKPNSF